jgi:hypothetical protein
MKYKTSRYQPDGSSWTVSRGPGQHQLIGVADGPFDNTWMMDGLK